MCVREKVMHNNVSGVCSRTCFYRHMITTVKLTDNRLLFCKSTCWVRGGSGDVAAHGDSVELGRIHDVLTVW